MKNKYKISLLAGIIVVLMLLDLYAGTTSVSFNKIIRFLSCRLIPQQADYLILSTIRLPRMLSAVAAGLCLSMSGLLMQSFFRNPLAGPYVLGISSGASLGAAFFIMGFSALHVTLPSSILHSGIAGFSILGAAFFMYVIFILSLRMNNSLSVLISGILLGTAANAIITLFQYTSNDIQLRSFIFWNMGSISNASTITGIVLILTSVVLLIFLTYRSKSFDVWLLGEEHAQSLGLNINVFTFMVFLITAILTGLSTAYFGPIAFIGLIAPHIARLIFKTNIHQWLFLTTSMIGIILMLLSDILLQGYASLFQSSMLPLNTVISLLSLPIWAYLFIKKKELWM